MNLNYEMLQYYQYKRVIKKKQRNEVLVRGKFWVQKNSFKIGNITKYFTVSRKE